jgi:hypothetical protein
VIKRWAETKESGGHDDNVRQASGHEEISERKNLPASHSREYMMK